MKSPFEQTLDQVRDFLKSRAILTAAELDLFTRVDEKPRGARELSEALGLDLRATTRLLDCIVGLELMEKEGNLYKVSEKGANFSSRHPESVLPMILHMNHLWDSWSHLTETVRQGSNPARKPVTERGKDSLTSFIGAMHVIGRKLAGEIADAYDLAPFNKLLDIGGASGTYTMAFLKKNSAMTAVLFDLEEVIAMADERLKKAGLRDRVELIAGNFEKDDLPTGCDLALLSAIIHQNSPAQNLELYQKIHRTLVPGGALLIRDHVMEESRIEPSAGALFALNMLVNTSGGDTFTFEEIKETLEQAGFVDVRLVRKGERMDCLVDARKPGT